MAGGRLTHDDRRNIAAWLADGLEYAEMGRRLGRATSTVTREVARNGGPSGYDPDSAQQDTERRTRRPGRRPVAAPDVRQSEAARRFADEFAVLLAGTGLPRMASRVFVGLLLTDSGSLTSADLVRRLRVSPASVSKAIGYLEAVELVERGQDPGGRRERYRVADDVWHRVWRADTGAHARVAEAAQRGTHLLGPETPPGTRLRAMGQFFARISHHMDGNDQQHHDSGHGGGHGAGHGADDGADDDGRPGRGFGGASVSDAMTVIAALVHAARPLTVDALAKALGWPAQRAADALDMAGRRPDLSWPLVLGRPGRGTYAVEAAPDRLSAAQRAALAVTSGRSGDPRPARRPRP
ncbi:MarR family transcriptional regulator [Nonomuraea sp. NPDC049419]|uniref:GbsR/MarR family transcriptional regulator n=1 Tax=Nonomuraea sp. NPDC049419 TaxID=3155772 RepID=UPI003440EE78